MARTRDPEIHALKRDAFVDAAQRLIAVKGYGAMSIQDVLAEVGASKGAFYHYFDSKQALLDAVVERMVQEATATVRPLVEDPGLSATDKLQGLFSGIANWKTERMELMLAVLRVWLSDGNALVRERFRHSVVVTFTPVLTTVVEQGITDRSFTVTDPPRTARVLVSLLLGANEHASELFASYQGGLVTLADVEGALNAYPDAFERVLGAHPGSLRWVEPGALQRWFD